MRHKTQYQRVFIYTVKKIKCLVETTLLFGNAISKLFEMEQTIIAYSFFHDKYTKKVVK